VQKWRLRYLLFIAQGVAVGLGYFALTGRKEINQLFNQSIN